MIVSLSSLPSLLWEELKGVLLQGLQDAPPAETERLLENQPCLLTQGFCFLLWKQANRDHLEMSVQCQRDATVDKALASLSTCDPESLQGWSLSQEQVLSKAGALRQKKIFLKCAVVLQIHSAYLEIFVYGWREIQLILYRVSIQAWSWISFCFQPSGIYLLALNFGVTPGST